MPRYELRMNGVLYNIDELYIDRKEIDDFVWNFTVQCNSCNEVALKPLIFTFHDKIELLKGAFTHAQYKCKFCSRTVCFAFYDYLDLSW
mmetsp:Transcript_3824/g.6685  ORF Transcript_3824/g.6685 Transcript_3824/m.6685 type:complete len:89 (-) Transcript_3824:364-630(-)